MKPILTCLLVCALVLIGSCTGKTVNETAASSARLKLMQGFPPEVNGCSCYFSPAEKEFSKEKYLFVSDLDSNAYVSINGKLTRLKLASTTREEGTANERDYQETFSDGLYTVVVNIYYKEHTGDEVWWNTGDIKLFFKDVELESINFLGECGC